MCSKKREVSPSTVQFISESQSQSQLVCVLMLDLRLLLYLECAVPVRSSLQDIAQPFKAQRTSLRTRPKSAYTTAPIRKEDDMYTLTVSPHNIRLPALSLPSSIWEGLHRDFEQARRRGWMARLEKGACVSCKVSIAGCFARETIHALKELRRRRLI